MKQINELHNSVNQNQFDTLWLKVSNTWLKYPSLEAFHKYFKKQWIDSSFNKWAVFHTPPGYTTTNNPIESYNKSIKHYFTNRLKLNLIPAFKIFQDLIHFESMNEFHYKTSISINKHQENKAKLLDIKKFDRINKQTYEYNHKSGKKSIISLLNQSCSCRFFADKCICYHLILVAITECVSLPGMQSFNKFSLRRRRKLDKEKTQTDFDEESDFDEQDDVDSIAIESNNDVRDADYELAVVHEPIHEILEARIIEIPKKRGRPPKVSSALKIDSTQTVTVNTVNTVLRRSKRNK